MLHHLTTKHRIKISIRRIIFLTLTNMINPWAFRNINPNILTPHKKVPYGTIYIQTPNLKNF